MRSGQKIVDERHRVQQAIIDRVGADGMDQAYRQFCLVCKKAKHNEYGCLDDLIPLTRDGNRCPYFTP